jgi:hypothetical protein
LVEKDETQERITLNMGNLTGKRLEQYGASSTCNGFNSVPNLFANE